MRKEKCYYVELHCDFAERWRYNIELQAASYDAQGHQCGYRACSSHIAEATAALKRPPEGVEIPSCLTLTTPTGASVELLIYVIPHALPEETQIDHTPYNECRLVVYDGDCEIRCETIRINPWGGASERIKIKG